MTSNSVMEKIVRFHKNNPKKLVDWFSEQSKPFKKYPEFFKKLFKDVLSPDDFDGMGAETFLAFRIGILDQIKKDKDFESYIEQETDKMQSYSKDAFFKCASSLDMISDILESKGLFREAYQLDIIANTLESNIPLYFKKDKKELPPDAVDSYTEFIQKEYKDKIPTPYELEHKYAIGVITTPEWIAKTLNIPLHKVQKAIDEEKAEKDIKDKERLEYLNELKEKVEKEGFKALLRHRVTFVVYANEWYKQKVKELLGEWGKYEHDLADIYDGKSSMAYYLYSSYKDKKDVNWVLECPFVPENIKKDYRHQIEKYGPIKVGDVIKGFLRKGRGKDPILVNTGKEHPIIIVNGTPPEDQWIGKHYNQSDNEVTVKIKRVLDRVIIADFVSMDKPKEPEQLKSIDDMDHLSPERRDKLKKQFESLNKKTQEEPKKEPQKDISDRYDIIDRGPGKRPLYRSKPVKVTPTR